MFILYLYSRCTNWTKTTENNFMNMHDFDAVSKLNDSTTPFIAYITQLNLTLHVHSPNCTQTNHMEMHDFKVFWQFWRLKSYKQKKKQFLLEKQDWENLSNYILTPNPRPHSFLSFFFFSLTAKYQMVPFFCAQLKCVLIVKRPQGLESFG